MARQFLITQQQLNNRKRNQKSTVGKPVQFDNQTTVKGHRVKDCAVKGSQAGTFHKIILKSRKAIKNFYSSISNHISYSFSIN